MLRLFATVKEIFITKVFRFKKISIKQAIFIIEIFSTYVKAHTQKKKSPLSTVGPLLAQQNSVRIKDLKKKFAGENNRGFLLHSC